jgi:tetratricopeptide (TPR) repeat protein
VKRLKQVLDIGPKYAEQFERNGIRTVRDLARWENLPDLSARTEIPLELLQPWHTLALQKLTASRYRRGIALLIGVVVAAALGYEARTLFQSPDAIAQGNALYDKGRYLDALDRYDKAIKLNPNSAIAYANKGLSFRMLGHYPEALAALDKAIALSPEFVWAYNQRGAVYSDEQNYAQAIVNYNMALELDPDYKFAFEKAFDLRKLGRYKEALDALNRAIAIDPQWRWPYEERGSLYHDNLFQYERAYQDLKKVSELSADHVFDPDLAEAALTSGRFSEAYTVASKLLADDQSRGLVALDVSEKCAVRFVAISALLLGRNTVQAKLELEEFIAYYKSAESGLRRQWDYSGTQHFIAGRTMDNASKKIILDLIGLLQERPVTTIQQIEPLVQTLR